MGRFSISLANARDNDATVLAGNPRAGGGNMPSITASGQADEVVGRFGPDRLKVSSNRF